MNRIENVKTSMPFVRKISVNVLRHSTTEMESVVCKTSLFNVANKYMATVINKALKYHVFNFPLEPKGIYNSPCLPDNSCSDTNTACRQGVCLCASSYYRRQNLCGNVLNLLASYFDNVFQQKMERYHSKSRSRRLYSYTQFFR